MSTLADALTVLGSLVAFTMLGLIIRLTFRRGRGPGDT